ncbi:MAG: hypothetical protein K0B09_08075 [Bacteroidales bacterium]|nr:hypothetical protein [Bacteroidales bacterium]
MNKLLSIVFLLTAMLALGNVSYAQRGFDDFGTEEGIRIQYRWTRHIPLAKESNAALSLRLTNEHPHPVIVSLSVRFFRDEQPMFESPENNYCLEAGQSLRGALANMRFMAEGITLDMTQQEWFSWKISEISVKQVDSCK